MPSCARIIHIQPEAPAKPVWGAPCNGCGVCCLAEPCPVGVVLSTRRKGACSALVWAADALVYRCGAIAEPRAVLARVLPAWARGLAVPLAPLLRVTTPRWISAGSGCDSTLEVSALSGKMFSAPFATTNNQNHD